MKNVQEFAAVDRPLSPQTCSLDRLDIGQRATVVGVEGDRDLRRRLLEMGFCNGVAVEVIRRAPLGDPVEFFLRGYYLSLRQAQACHVRVVPAKR